MRCKNCGFDNQEGRYICENCGSPLFDDNDQIVPEEDDPENQPPQKLDEPDEPEYDTDEEEKAKNKKSIIIIIVLAVVLVAMIVGIIVAAVTNSGEETTSDPSVTASSDISEQAETERSTRSRTTTERSTESTTENTTERTTTTTTVARYTVSVDIDGNGSISGDGTFEAGKRTTLIATPNEGYQFTGWYDNDTGAQVASATRYTIRVDSNRNLTARFAPLPSQNEPASEDQSNEQG